MFVLLKPKNIPLFTGFQAAELLKRKDMRSVVDVSLDLGLSFVKGCIDKGGVSFEGLRLSWDKLEKMAETPEDVFVLTPKVDKLSWSDGNFYKLVLPSWGGAPTLEVNGVRMHRTVGVTPEKDAEMKVSLLPRLKGLKVLDICTGLGYTAIAALKRDAAEVITVEKDPNVLEMASYNPWSQKLFTERVKIVVKDALVFLEECRDLFDAVIHDPPTFRLAEELYTFEFYHLVRSVMRRGAVMVHYVGEPGHRRRVRLYAGVMKRLRSAGFDVSYMPEVRCVRAVKV